MSFQRNLKEKNYQICFENVYTVSKTERFELILMFLTDYDEIKSEDVFLQHSLIELFKTYEIDFNDLNCIVLKEACRNNAFKVVEYILNIGSVDPSVNENEILSIACLNCSNESIDLLLRDERVIFGFKHYNGIIALFVNQSYEICEKILDRDDVKDVFSNMPKELINNIMHGYQKYITQKKIEKF